MRYFFMTAACILFVGCTASFKYFSAGNIVIPPATLMQIKNISDKKILLDIAHHEGKAQAGYASELAPGHQSVFWHQNGELQLACLQEPLQPNMPKVDCAKVLEVKVLPVEKKMGNGDYWVSENKLG